ncbi:MAG: hypothetical protein EZS28_017010 [Streblomastix strix]|uniref:Uncharacterized protein n=1 Tax=Streblomastix strix TaxID=222440 RepID=A0A5J4VY58_9EUKA|nr:MAG: hypothetical protein EZS28_017010 [Streblomastix strix]
MNVTLMCSGLQKIQTTLRQKLNQIRRFLAQIKIIESILLKKFDIKEVSIPLGAIFGKRNSVARYGAIPYCTVTKSELHGMAQLLLHGMARCHGPYSIILQGKRCTVAWLLLHVIARIMLLVMAHPVMRGGITLAARKWYSGTIRAARHGTIHAALYGRSEPHGCAIRVARYGTVAWHLLHDITRTMLHVMALLLIFWD